MKSNLDLYKIAEEKNIIVDTTKLPLNKSFSTRIRDKEFIIMDKSVVTDSADERVHLGHELGHCATGAYYTIGADKIVRSKAEARANRWAIMHLIPKEEFEELLRQGYQQWELAEYYNVTESFIKTAYHLYFEIEICA